MPRRSGRGSGRGRDKDQGRGRQAQKHERVSSCGRRHRSNQHIPTEEQNTPVTQEQPADPCHENAQVQIQNNQENAEEATHTEEDLRQESTGNVSGCSRDKAERAASGTQAASVLYPIGQQLHDKHEHEQGTPAENFDDDGEIILSAEQDEGRKSSENAQLIAKGNLESERWNKSSDRYASQHEEGPRILLDGTQQGSETSPRKQLAAASAEEKEPFWDEEIVGASFSGLRERERSVCEGGDILIGCSQFGGQKSFPLSREKTISLEDTLESIDSSPESREGAGSFSRLTSDGCHVPEYWDMDNMPEIRRLCWAEETETLQDNRDAQGAAAALGQNWSGGSVPIYPFISPPPSDNLNLGSDLYEPDDSFVNNNAHNFSNGFQPIEPDGGPYINGHATSEDAEEATDSNESDDEEESSESSTEMNISVAVQDIEELVNKETLEMYGSYGAQNIALQTPVGHSDAQERPSCAQLDVQEVQQTWPGEDLSDQGRDTLVDPQIGQVGSADEYGHAFHAEVSHSPAEDAETRERNCGTGNVQQEDSLTEHQAGQSRDPAGVTQTALYLGDVEAYLRRVLLLDEHPGPQTVLQMVPSVTLQANQEEQSVPQPKSPTCQGTDEVNENPKGAKTCSEYSQTSPQRGSQIILRWNQQTRQWVAPELSLKEGPVEQQLTQVREYLHILSQRFPAPGVLPREEENNLQEDVNLDPEQEDNLQIGDQTGAQSNQLDGGETSSEETSQVSHNVSSEMSAQRQPLNDIISVVQASLKAISAQENPSKYPDLTSRKDANSDLNSRESRKRIRSQIEGTISHRRAHKESSRQTDTQSDTMSSRHSEPQSHVQAGQHQCPKSNSETGQEAAYQVNQQANLVDSPSSSNWKPSQQANSQSNSNAYQEKSPFLCSKPGQHQGSQSSVKKCRRTGAKSVSKGTEETTQTVQHLTTSEPNINIGPHAFLHAILQAVEQACREAAQQPIFQPEQNSERLPVDRYCGRPERHERRRPASVSPVRDRSGPEAMSQPDNQENIYEHNRRRSHSYSRIHEHDRFQDPRASTPPYEDNRQRGAGIQAPRMQQYGSFPNYDHLMTYGYGNHRLQPYAPGGPNEDQSNETFNQSSLPAGPPPGQVHPMPRANQRQVLRGAPFSHIRPQRAQFNAIFPLPNYQARPTQNPDNASRGPQVRSVPRGNTFMYPRPQWGRRTAAGRIPLQRAGSIQGPGRHLAVPYDYGNPHHQRFIRAQSQANVGQPSSVQSSVQSMSGLPILTNTQASSFVREHPPGGGYQITGSNPPVQQPGSVQNLSVQQSSSVQNLPVPQPGSVQNQLIQQPDSVQNLSTQQSGLIQNLLTQQPGSVLNLNLPKQKSGSVQNLPIQQPGSVQNLPMQQPASVQNLSTQQPHLVPNLPIEPGSDQNILIQEPGSIQNLLIQQPGSTQNQPTQQYGSVQNLLIQQPGSIQNLPKQQPGSTQSQPTQQYGSVQTLSIQQPGSIQNLPIQQPGSTQNQPTQQYGSVQTLPIQQPGSIQNLPIQQPSSTQNQPTQQYGSVQTLPIQQPGSVQNLPIQQPGSTQNLPTQQYGSIQNLPIQQYGSVQNLPIQQYGSVQNLPIQQSGSVQNLPIQQYDLVQNLPTQQPGSVQNLPIQQPDSIQNLPIQQYGSAQNLPTQQYGLVQNLPIQQSDSVQTLPMQQPGSIQNLSIQQPGSVQNLPMQQSDSIQNLPIQQSRSLQHQQRDFQNWRPGQSQQIPGIVTQVNPRVGNFPPNSGIRRVFPQPSSIYNPGLQPFRQIYQPHVRHGIPYYFMPQVHVHPPSNTPGKSDASDVPRLSQSQDISERATDTSETSGTLTLKQETNSANSDVQASNQIERGRISENKTKANSSHTSGNRTPDASTGSTRMQPRTPGIQSVSTEIEQQYNLTAYSSVGSSTQEASEDSEPIAKSAATVSGPSDESDTCLRRTRQSYPTTRVNHLLSHNETASNAIGSRNKSRSSVNRNKRNWNSSTENHHSNSSHSPDQSERYSASPPTHKNTKQDTRATTVSEERSKNISSKPFTGIKNSNQNSQSAREHQDSREGTREYQSSKNKSERRHEREELSSKQDKGQIKLLPREDSDSQRVESNKTVQRPRQTPSPNIDLDPKKDLNSGKDIDTDKKFSPMKDPSLEAGLSSRKCMKEDNSLDPQSQSLISSQLSGKNKKQGQFKTSEAEQKICSPAVTKSSTTEISSDQSAKGSSVPGNNREPNTASDQRSQAQILPSASRKNLGTSETQQDRTSYKQNQHTVKAATQGGSQSTNKNTREAVLGSAEIETSRQTKRDRAERTTGTHLSNTMPNQSHSVRTSTKTDKKETEEYSTHGITSASGRQKNNTAAKSIKQSNSQARNSHELGVVQTEALSRGELNDIRRALHQAPDNHPFETRDDSLIEETSWQSVKLGKKKKQKTKTETDGAHGVEQGGLPQKLLQKHTAKNPPRTDRPDCRRSERSDVQGHFTHMSQETSHRLRSVAESSFPGDVEESSQTDTSLLEEAAVVALNDEQFQTQVFTTIESRQQDSPGEIQRKGPKSVQDSSAENTGALVKAATGLKPNANNTRDSFPRNEEEEGNRRASKKRRKKSMRQRIRRHSPSELELLDVLGEDTDNSQLTPSQMYECEQGADDCDSQMSKDADAPQKDTQRATSSDAFSKPVLNRNDKESISDASTASIPDPENSGFLSDATTIPPERAEAMERDTVKFENTKEKSNNPENTANRPGAKGKGKKKKKRGHGKTKDNSDVGEKSLHQPSVFIKGKKKEKPEEPDLDQLIKHFTEKDAQSKLSQTFSHRHAVCESCGCRRSSTGRISCRCRCHRPPSPPPLASEPYPQYPHLANGPDWYLGSDLYQAQQRRTGAQLYSQQNQEQLRGRCDNSEQLPNNSQQGAVSEPGKKTKVHSKKREDYKMEQTQQRTNNEEVSRADSNTSGFLQQDMRGMHKNQEARVEPSVGVSTASTSSRKRERDESTKVKVQHQRNDDYNEDRSGRSQPVMSETSSDRVLPDREGREDANETVFERESLPTIQTRGDRRNEEAESSSQGENNEEQRYKAEAFRTLRQLRNLDIPKDLPEELKRKILHFWGMVLQSLTFIKPRGHQYELYIRQLVPQERGPDDQEDGMGVHIVKSQMSPVNIANLNSLREKLKSLMVYFRCRPRKEWRKMDDILRNLLKRVSTLLTAPVPQPAPAAQRQAQGLPPFNDAFQSQINRSPPPSASSVQCDPSLKTGPTIIERPESSHTGQRSDVSGNQARLPALTRQPENEAGQPKTRQNVFEGSLLFQPQRSNDQTNSTLGNNEAYDKVLNSVTAFLETEARKRLIDSSSHNADHEDRASGDRPIGVMDQALLSSEEGISFLREHICQVIEDLYAKDAEEKMALERNSPGMAPDRHRSGEQLADTETLAADISPNCPPQDLGDQDTSEDSLSDLPALEYTPERHHLSSENSGSQTGSNIAIASQQHGNSSQPPSSTSSSLLPSQALAVKAAAGNDSALEPSLPSLKPYPHIDPSVHRLLHELHHRPVDQLSDKSTEAAPTTEEATSLSNISNTVTNTNPGLNVSDTVSQPNQNVNFEDQLEGAVGGEPDIRNMSQFNPFRSAHSRRKRDARPRQKVSHSTLDYDEGLQLQWALMKSQQETADGLQRWQNNNSRDNPEFPPYSELKLQKFPSDTPLHEIKKLSPPHEIQQLEALPESNTDYSQPCSSPTMLDTEIERNASAGRASPESPLPVSFSSLLSEVPCPLMPETQVGNDDQSAENLPTSSKHPQLYIESNDLAPEIKGPSSASSAVDGIPSSSSLSTPVSENKPVTAEIMAPFAENITPSEEMALTRTPSTETMNTISEIATPSEETVTRSPEIGISAAELIALATAEMVELAAELTPLPKTVSQLTATETPLANNEEFKAKNETNVAEKDTTRAVVETQTVENKMPVTTTETSVAVTETPLAVTQNTTPDKEKPVTMIKTSPTVTEAPVVNEDISLAQTENSEAVPKTPTAEKETSVAETPVEKTGISVAVAKTSPAETKASVAVSEMEAEKNETSASETETSVAVNKTPVEKKGTSPVETGISVVETETSATVTEASVAVIQTSEAATETSVAKSETSVAVTETLMAVIRTPVEKKRTSAVETGISIVETETSIEVTEESVAVIRTSVAAAETSVAAAETSVAETEMSVAITETSIAETEMSVAITETSVVEAEMSVAMTETSVVEAEMSVAMTETSVVEAEMSVAMTETSVAVTETSVTVTQTSAAMAEISVTVAERQVEKNEMSASETEMSVALTETVPAKFEKPTPENQATVELTVKTEVTEAPVEITEKTVELTRSQMEVTDKTEELTESLVAVTEEPVETTDLSVVVTQASQELTERPVKLTESAEEVTEKTLQLVETVELTESPVEMTEKNVELTKLLVEVTKKTVKLTESPVEVTEKTELKESLVAMTEKTVQLEKTVEMTDPPVELTESPVKVAEKIVQLEETAALTESPAALTDSPVEVTDKAVELKESPAVRTEAPVKMAEALVELTEETELPDSPKETTEQPVDMTEKTVELPDSPAKTTDQPVDVTKETVELPDSPAEATDQPVDMTEKTIKLTESPAEATDQPVDMTEKTVELPASPAEATEQPVDMTDKTVELPDSPAETNDQPVDMTEKTVELPESPTETTDQPVDMTEKTVELPESPAEAIEQPVEVTEKATNLTESPAEATESPVDMIEETVELTESPVEMPEKTIELTESPEEVTEKIVELKESPVEMTEVPVQMVEAIVEVTEETEMPDSLGETTDQPVDMTEKTVELTESPAEATDQLVDMTEKTVELPASPAEATEQPVDMTDKTVELPDSPAETNDQQVDMTEKTVELPESPTETTDQPVDMTEKTVELPESPAEAIEQLVEVTEKAINLTESPAEATESPKDIIEETVELTESPVEMPEKTIELTESPVEVTEKIVELKESPVEMTEVPVQMAEAIVEVTEETEMPDSLGETTDQPVDVTEKTVELTESPAEATDQPVDMTEKTVELTESPAETTEQPVDMTQKTVELPDSPAEAIEQPVEVTEKATNLTESLEEATELPVHMTENTIESPAETTESPVDVTEKTVELPDSSAEKNDQPVDMTMKTVELPDSPAEATEQPVDMTEKTVELPESPAETTEQPVDMTEKTVELTDSPAETTDQPVDMTEKTVELPDSPAETTEQPVDMTEKTLELTESPAEATESQVEVTEKATKLTEAPVEVTEKTIELTVTSRSH